MFFYPQMEEQEKELIKNPNGEFEKKYLDKLELMTKTCRWIEDIREWKLQNQDQIRLKVDEMKTNYENEISDLKRKIEIFVNKLKNKESDSESESESETDSENEIILPSKQYITQQMNKSELYQKQINELNLSLNDTKSLFQLAEEMVIKLYLQNRLRKLIHNFVTEYTPTGNVFMSYDESKGAFIYYANNSIMYQTLLVVCRKFVCMYHCTPLYTEHVDKHIKFIYMGKMNNFNITQKQPKQIKQKGTYLSFADFKKNKNQFYNGIFN